MIYLEPRKTYDQFIVGTVIGINLEEKCLVYSKAKIINYLADNMGQEIIPNHLIGETAYSIYQANLDFALEYFEFNIAGAYMGPDTPLFLEDYVSENFKEDY